MGYLLSAFTKLRLEIPASDRNISDCWHTNNGKKSAWGFLGLHGRWHCGLPIQSLFRQQNSTRASQIHGMVASVAEQRSKLAAEATDGGYGATFLAAKSNFIWQSAVASTCSGTQAHRSHTHSEGRHFVFLHVVLKNEHLHQYSEFSECGTGLLMVMNKRRALKWL